jgi:hypothetical protein
MDVLEEFAGNESLGLGLDTTGANALIYSGNRRGVVPEVGLEPESVKKAVQSWLGIAFISPFAVETELKAKSLVLVRVRS